MLLITHAFLFVAFFRVTSLSPKKNHAKFLRCRSVNRKAWIKVFPLEVEPVVFRARLHKESLGAVPLN